MSRPPIPSTSSFPYKLKPEDYSHSPIHHAVVLRNHATLTRLVSTLPRLEDPLKVNTEAESLSQEKLAEEISSFIDRRDVPLRETPLHLAVKLNDLSAVETLTSAGADPSLHNSAGWNPLQEALTSGRNHAIVLALARHHHRCSWSKFRRRLPRFVSALRRMRDFYMEISFHFESSVIPFVKSLLPSDTYKIWKREGNLRADMSLAGFDGLKLQRANQSILFLGDGDDFNNVPWGSLLVLNRDKRKIFDAFENTGPDLSETEARDYVGQSSVGRPGMDVTKAELVGRTNWRRQEKTETVGEWKAKVYEVHNVIFSFRSRKVVKNNKNDSVLPIELDFDEDEDGFLVAENPNFGMSDKRRHSSFVKEDIGRGDIVTVGRKSVDIIPSASSSGLTASNSRSSRSKAPAVVASNGNGDLGGSATKEKEFVRSLRPAIWLTEQFPLKTEELLPLLDILANKVKAVRRMRELLTTKFPPGTFPVKFAIPVVPTVRVVITFTKFVDLQPTEQFYTPFSSPLHFSQCGKGLAGILEEEEEDNQEFETHNSSASSSTSKSTLRPRRSVSWSSSKQQQRHRQEELPEEQSDPFAIPSGYTWRSRKSKATRKS